MKNKKLLIALAALVVVIAAMLTIYFVTLPETSAGKKTCTITVIHGDETTKTFTVTTNEEYLPGSLPWSSRNRCTREQRQHRARPRAAQQRWA